MSERGHSNRAAFSSTARRFTKSPCFKKKSSVKNRIKKNVNDLIACDLLGIAKALKRSNLSCLRLYQKHANLQKRKAENRKLGFLGYRHSEALFTFSRAVSWALSGGGWLQELELGFALWERDLKIIAESLSHTATLKRLSFANSEFGDHSLQILGRSLQECAQLEVLNLSACALTDGIAPLLSTILKAHVCRKTQADWQASLRSSKGVNALTMRPKGLVALDVSLNQFSDITVQTICGVLRIGNPLEALNLRGNQLTRLSGKLLLDIMEEWGILRFVDLRDNVDNSLMGVLEDGQHLTSFSRVQPPFWMSSVSTKSKRGCNKGSGKKSRESILLEGTKPKDHMDKISEQKRSSRPQSAPSRHPVNNPLKAQRHKSAGVSDCSSKNTDVRKGVPRIGALDTRALQPTRRPSTSPEKSQLNTGKKQAQQSYSLSPEFAAWDHDGSSAKENRFPFDTNQTRVASRERAISCEEAPWRDYTRKPAPHTDHEDGHVLRQMDITKSDRLKENVEFGNCQPPGGKIGSRKPKQVKSLVEGMAVSFNKMHAAAMERSQGKGDSGKEAERNPVSRPLIQRTEWNSFLKEITQAIFHLQERLDDLFGPADPDSLTEQAASQLQVLC